MKYYEAEQKLQQWFEAKNYRGLIQKRLRHVHQDLIYTCSNGSKIYISYPGLKARLGNNGKIVYDYRVDIVTSNFQASLSHVNIIVDIYNKCLHKFDIELMRQLLIKTAREGQFDLNQYSQLESYSSQPIDTSIIRCAERVHAKLGKTYNSMANQFDLTFEELLSSIFWIVLQEDINYPMPRYQGRKMPFSRYLEALYCFESEYSLDDVIGRALVEGFPPADWVDMNYSFRRFIN
ncbi:MAG: hypothetical protein KME08_19655 [Aphanothece sp. CMT-3BRIN-NPC111]|jgi:hypothetical protein|nr:hypothetical protein [Aphanothece sp. CMT-3BRIN-NPC111]